MLNVRQKKTAVSFGRLSRGLLWSYLTETDGTGPDPNPSVGRLWQPDASGTLLEGVSGTALQLPGPAACIQADLRKAYLMSIGIGFVGALYKNGVGLFNNAAPASVETFANPTTGFCAPAAKVATVGTNIVDLAYGMCKTEWRDGALSTFAAGGRSDKRATLQDFPYVPRIMAGTDANAKAQGNSYVTSFRNVYAMKSNVLTFVSLPAYGSVGMSVEGAAEITVNADGNGDVTYDLVNINFIRFPCKITYRIFDAPNKGGVLRGFFTVRDTFGGDVIGTTRTILQSYPFTPKSLSGLVSWHKPESIGGADGTALNVWTDSSPFARPLSKSASVAAPKIQNGAYKGLSVVRFDGSGQMLFSDPIGLALRANATGTVAVALRWAPGNSLKGLLSFMAAGVQGFNINVTSGTSLEQFLTGDNGGPAYYPDGFGASNTIHITMFEFDAANSRVRAWWASTARPSTGAVADVDVSRLIQFSNFYPPLSLGTFYCDAGGASPALYGVGDIGEVVVYNKRLRDADRMNLMAYLSARWL